MHDVQDLQSFLQAALGTEAPFTTSSAFLLFCIATYIVASHGLTVVLEQPLPEAQPLYEQHHWLSSLALQ